MKFRLTLLAALTGLLVLAGPSFAGTCCPDGGVAIGCESGDASKCVVKMVGNHGGKNFKFWGGDQEGAYLGVTLAEVDEETAEEAGLRSEAGALIRSVFDDTPADEAGLQAGDIVTEFAGESIESVGQLVKLVGGEEPGNEVRVRVRRDGKTESFNITLAEKESSFTFNMGEDGEFDLQSMFEMKGFGDNTFFCGPQGKLGVEVRDLDEDLADYFDGTDGKGALVMSVFDGTAAEAAGLKPGDVLIELGGLEIDDTGDLVKAVKKSLGEEDVELVFVRQGREKRVDVEIEAQTPHMSMMRGMPHKMGFGDKHKLHQLMEDADSDTEDLHKVIQKLEQRLEEMEKKLDDR